MADIPIERAVKGLRVFFIKMSPERLALLEKHFATEDDESEFPASMFSEPVQAFEHSRNRTLVALVLRDGRIIRAGVAHRSFSAGTGLSQVRIGKTVSIAQLSLAPVLSVLPARHRKRTIATAESMGLVSEKASESLLVTLGKLDSQIAQVVELASQVRHNPIEDLSDRDQLRIQQERDAALTAMFLAGINRTQFLESGTDSFAKERWFMDQVGSARLREDTSLYNDASKFPGFENVAEHVSGVVRMRHLNVLLSIFLINRQPLEQLTGSDLIYYNESFGAFVFVQYKAMESAGDCDTFRLPNEGLRKEIERMREIEQSLVASGAYQKPHDFRLSTNAFFLKFCPRIVQQPTEPDLVPGMYFPLDHWSILAASDLLIGDAGGRLLRYQKKDPVSNADRYLSNSDFAVLVRNGWVGTSANQSAILEKLITQTLESGRSVTFATAGPVPPESDDPDPDFLF
jgi:hypothetical protein